MKRIISFAVYGTDPLYLQGALRNAKLQRDIYPGWSTRFHVSQEIPEDLIEALRKLGAEVVRKQRVSTIDGMFWRFLPVSEEGVDAVVIRDTDSRLTLRERLAVDEWLDSGKSLHIMRDHPLHQQPILGGMWGCRGGVLNGLAEQINAWKLWQKKGYDQDFLSDEVYSRLSDDAFVHSELCRYDGEIAHPFPIRRNGGEFVGCVYDPNRDTLTESQHAENAMLFEAAAPRIHSRPRRPWKFVRDSHEWLRSLKRRAA